MTTRFYLWFFAALAVSTYAVHAQQNACYPVLLCPYAGAGGSGGTAQAGSGGVAAGSGGSGGVGGLAQAGSGGAGQGGVGGAAGGGMKTGANTWYLQPGWGFGSPFNGTPNFATAQPGVTNIWNPAFINDLKAYGGLLRLMDWNGTNHSKVTTWSQRRLPTDQGNASIYVDQSTGVVPGLAYEWQFDLCNRAGLTCWITLPAQANDDYLTQFARLAKQRVVGTLVVEYSNEIDGGWFTQTNYAIQQGQALNLPGSNQWYKGAAYATSRTVAIAKALRAEFGSEMGQRVMTARCGVGNTDLLRESLTSVYKSSQYNPTQEKIDVLCFNGYVGNGSDGASWTVAQGKAAVDSLENASDGWKNEKAMQQQFGIAKLAVYEGGIHLLQNAGTFAGKPDAGQVMSYLLDRASLYFDMFYVYTDASTWPNTSGNGAWGLKNQIGGAETSKSTAVKSWRIQH